jgi:hypothetical protein
MYEVDEQDVVVELEDVPQSDVGAPQPIVLSDEHKVLLAFRIQDTPEGWDGTWVNVTHPGTESPIAIVDFGPCISYMFGGPNDEAFEGHPLYERGLAPYSVFEVQNSSWLRKLERMNSVHQYHKPERYWAFKHFVFAFHDSTFECVAREFKFDLFEGSMESVIPEMQRRLFARN